MTGKVKIGMGFAAILAASAISGALSNLAQEEMQPAQRAFWIVKHGIKMTGMPAWGKTLDDAAIWDIVAFVRKMPAMSPETYQDLSRPHVE
jgi:mono/diheme cytochrome c family protein